MLEIPYQNTLFIGVEKLTFLEQIIPLEDSQRKVRIQYTVIPSPTSKFRDSGCNCSNERCCLLKLTGVWLLQHFSLIACLSKGLDNEAAVSCKV